MESNISLLGAPGIAIRSKDATRGSWPSTRSKDATSSKDASRLEAIAWSQESSNKRRVPRFKIRQCKIEGRDVWLNECDLHCAQTLTKGIQ